MVAKNPRKRTLDIHPGIGWREGHRYIVALRNLKRSNGRTIKAPRAFRIYRDGLPGGSRAVDRRDPHMQDIFNPLDHAGINPGELYLAWDFTISSRQGLTKRLLSIRDRSFAELGDRNLGDLKVAGAAPKFTITAPATSPASAGAWPGRWRRPAGSTSRAARPARASSSTSAGCRCAPPATSTTRLRLHRAEHERHHAGAAAAVRARPLPGLHGRRHDRPARAGLERRDLRHELLRHVPGGSGQRRQGVGRPVALPDDRRPPPAGDPRLHLPGPGDDPPAGLLVEPRVRRAHRHQAAVLRRRQPRRHHRRGADVGRARLRPQRADRSGPALQPPAHAQHAVPDLRPRSSTASTRTRSTRRWSTR